MASAVELDGVVLVLHGEVGGWVGICVAMRLSERDAKVHV